MNRYVALLRGINVGRAKRVAMADLRGMMGTLGHANVRTVLNSGNAVFDAQGGTAVSHASRMQAAFAEAFGFSSQIVVKTAAEFASAIADNPLLGTATDPSRLLLAFTQEKSTLPGLAGLAKTDWSPDAFALGKHAAYLWCADGVLESRLAKDAGRQLGELGTTRNWATVQKIGQLLA